MHVREGSVVHLKSHTQILMTVEKIITIEGCDSAHCIWFDQEYKMHRGDFRITTLIVRAQ
jgi:hypothetical protein